MTNYTHSLIFVNLTIIFSNSITARVIIEIIMRLAVNNRVSTKVDRVNRFVFYTTM